MYCKKLKATLSIRICLLRQNIAVEKKKGGENLTSFNKCHNCGYGKKIQLNPNPKLDLDVKRLMAQYMPRPERFKLIWKKPIKYTLKAGVNGNS